MDDLLTLYRRASEWTGASVAVVGDLSAPTPCADWTVRDLLNHMLDTQRYFLGAARGEAVSPPGPNPPDVLSDDPAADFAGMRAEMLSVYGDAAVVERTMPALGIAFADQLLHGWDLARALGRDATMPDGLAEAAYQAIHGRFTDDQRKGVFGPELPTPADATAQDRLLAYTGRDPRG
jgi:uncharacterized protein (TIGR03086 family)